MASIREEEDRILKELSSLGNPPYPDNVDGKYRSYPNHHPSKELIVSDGLHYLDKLLYDEDGRFWHRDRSEERDQDEERDRRNEEQWEKACKKKRGLVVLTKDLNLGKHDPKDTAKLIWDIREDHGRDNNNENDPTFSTAPFYENLRRWIYGLMTMSDSGEMPEYPTNEEAQKHFEEEPWVRMNLKKEAGKSSITPTILRRHIKESKTYLLKQLKLYKGASIYLDCASREGRKLLEELYDDIVPFRSDKDPWIYYSEKSSFIIINSYHPSYSHLWGESKRKEYYSDMREAVQAFFEDHPNFFKDEKASEDV